MGGSSSSSQTQNQSGTQTGSMSGTQSSTTAPWEASQPALNNILGQVYQNLGSTGVTGNEQNAFNSITNNANQFGAQFAPQINAYANNLLNGGGANAQAPALQSGLSQYQSQMGQYADPNYSSLNNPALQAALQQVQSDVTNQVNGQFAAAGRDMSGMNQQTLARGIAQGQAPLILNQYNQDQNNRLSAINSLYGAQNTTSGLLSGLNQQGLANQSAGISAAGQGLEAQNAGNNAALQAEAQRRGIPVQALGLLAQIGIPIAGLGSTNSGSTSGSTSGTSTGTGTTQGTQQMSGAQQFGLIAGGIGSLGKLFGGF